MLKLIAENVAVGAAVVATFLIVGSLIERARTGPAMSASFRLNTVYSALCLCIHAALRPAAAALSVLAVGALGGALVTLPSHGWGLVGGTIVFILAMDFAEYAFHRAQHAFPPLWALHSLHHSDRSFNVSTTNRHHWLELFLKTVTVYLVVALIFRPAQATFGIYAIVTWYNYFTHMNVKVGFGRLSFLVNSPRYHRIHHSRLAEHWNTNFAAIFPIFDVIFGAYRPARADEWPPTGLDATPEPRSIGETIIWPYRAPQPVQISSRGFGRAA